MTFEVVATYENGILKPKQPIALREGSEVQISILVPGGDPLAQVIGIGDGPEQGDASDQHDNYIYGE